MRNPIDNLLSTIELRFDQLSLDIPDDFVSLKELSLGSSFQRRKFAEALYFFVHVHHQSIRDIDNIGSLVERSRYQLRLTEKNSIFIDYCYMFIHMNLGCKALSNDICIFLSQVHLKDKPIRLISLLIFQNFY